MEAVDSDQETEEVHFARQADVHIDQDTDPQLLQSMIANTTSESPSFIMDLGDTLIFGEYGLSATQAQNCIKKGNSYFSSLEGIPICLINGNHDGENGFRLKLLSQSPILRNEAYFMPFQDLDSFSGNVTTANYYAFEKDNALFVVSDPFTYTEDPLAGWADKLGTEQLALAVNGSLLISSVDPGFRVGDVGLLTGVFETTGIKVGYDNFQLIRQESNSYSPRKIMGAVYN